LKTVYLRVLHNKVSDAVLAETLDLCPVNLTLSYRVNFEGAPEKWFNVENYVKFLTDHTRSMLRHAIKKHGIEEFYANSIQVIRDTVLGQSDAGGFPQGSGRHPEGPRHGSQAHPRAGTGGRAAQSRSGAARTHRTAGNTPHRERFHNAGSRPALP